MISGFIGKALYRSNPCAVLQEKLLPYWLCRW